VTGDGQNQAEQRRATSRRYSIYVGIAFAILIGIATVNTLRSSEGGLLGADTAEAGTPLPEFAVPELLHGEDADANVYQDNCGTSANPCPDDQQRTPACEVKLPNVITVCDLLDKPLVLSFWFSTPAECPPTQDAIDDAAARYRGKVNFLSIAVRGDRDQLRKIVEDRGWTMPVGWDRDGAVSNLYHVGVCPTVAFVLPGGVLREAKIGSDELEPDRLDANVDRLIAEARRRASEDR
jgi:AhpC/TSA family